MAMRFASPRRIKIILQEKKNPNPLCSGKQINANVFPVTEIQFRVPEHLPADDYDDADDDDADADRSKFN